MMAVREPPLFGFARRTQEVRKKQKSNIGNSSTFILLAREKGRVELLLCGHRVTSTKPSFSTGMLGLRNRVATSAFVASRSVALPSQPPCRDLCLPRAAASPHPRRDLCSPALLPLSLHQLRRDQRRRRVSSPDWSQSFRDWSWLWFPHSAGLSSTSHGFPLKFDEENV